LKFLFNCPVSGTTSRQKASSFMAMSPLGPTAQRCSFLRRTDPWLPGSSPRHGIHVRSTHGPPTVGMFTEVQRGRAIRN
jgi:hypothetical protein